MNNIYDYPKYYEIAYSYRDIPGEVDVLEQAIREFSHIEVRDFLEIACGNSPHMLELLKRGYSFSGLDISRPMLDFSRQKAETLGFTVNLYQGDLVDFELPEPVDFVYTMMGSLYVNTTADLLSHFASVYQALKPGGLYFLDWCIDFSPLDDTRDTWVMKRDDIEVKTYYSTRLLSAPLQHYKEEVTFLVRDGKNHLKLQNSAVRRGIYPQEFILAATKVNNFEFLGWWNDWDLYSPLENTRGEIIRPISLLRRPSTLVV